MIMANRFHSKIQYESKLVYILHFVIFIAVYLNYYDCLWSQLHHINYVWDGIICYSKQEHVLLTPCCEYVFEDNRKDQQQIPF